MHVSERRVCVRACMCVQSEAHLKHSGEAHLLMVSGRSKVHGARHICGAAIKLTTTVKQQERILVNLSATALLGPVMNDGAVWPCPCTARKACSRPCRERPL